MPATGPDFISLQARDLDASQAFYEQYLGLVRSQAGPPHAFVFETKPIAFALRDVVPGTDLASVASTWEWSANGCIPTTPCCSVEWSTLMTGAMPAGCLGVPRDSVLRRLAHVVTRSENDSTLLLPAVTLLGPRVAAHVVAIDR